MILKGRESGPRVNLSALEDAVVVTASLLLVWLFLLLAMWKNLANRLSQGWARMRGSASKHKVPLLHTLPYYLAITRSSCEVKEYLSILKSRVAEVARGHRGPPPKSLDADENFKPEHTLFLSQIKICFDLRTFWRSLGKKSAFLSLIANVNRPLTFNCSLCKM